MNDAEFLERFKQLEDIEVNDPYTIKIVEQARELEKYLNKSVNDSTNTESDYMEVTDLEKEWLAMMDSDCPYLYQQVAVTGEVTRAYHDDFSDTFKLEKVTYNHQPAICSGFTTLSVENEDGTSRFVVGHLFQTEMLGAAADCPPLVDYIPRLYAFAPVGDVDILANLPDEMNIATLTQEIPELLDDVDCTILNAMNECEALQNLASINISEEEDIPSETLGRLASYVTRRLEFDTVVPYEMSIKGLVFCVREDDQSTQDLALFPEPLHVLVSLTGLSLRGLPTLDENNTIHITDEKHWMIDVHILGNNSYDDNNQQIVVPVCNIETMRSMRRVAYSMDD